MVTSVINKIKSEYAFVDLLKPKTPQWFRSCSLSNQTTANVLASLRGFGTGLEAMGSRVHLPKFGGEIKADVAAGKKPFGHDIRGTPGAPSAQSILASLDNEAALKAAIANWLGNEGADFLRQLDDDLKGTRSEMGTDVGARETINTALGLFKLAFGSKVADKRMRALLAAIRGLQSDSSFDETKETAREYFAAASDLVKRDFRYVVFGHAHQAKRVDLGGGRWYFNSGTWADILRFPSDILALPEADALTRLAAFVEELKAGDFSKWTLFRPTYVRLDVDDTGKVAEPNRARLRLNRQT